jgi:hypothetical protein
MKTNTHPRVEELCEDYPPKYTWLRVESGNELTVYAKDTEGFEQPICAVEKWEGKLRVLVWPDAEDENSGPIITPIRRLP